MLLGKDEVVNENQIAPKQVYDLCSKCSVKLLLLMLLIVIILTSVLE